MTQTLPFRKRLWSLIKPYWKSEERWSALAIFTTIIGFNLAEVYLSVLLNEWNNNFYNALQNLDKTAFLQSLFRWTYLVGIYIVLVVYEVYLTQMLQIRWRRWMTRNYLGRYLRHQNYYRIQLFGAATDNPDQRVSEDIDQFIRISLFLVIGVVNKIVTIFSFMGILWMLSGSLDFTAFGSAWHIAGYMVWAAVAYSLIGTGLTFFIGGPLIKLTFDQQHYEANFRFRLMRLRENSESIAFYKGEKQEESGLLTHFSDIVANWRQIMRRERKLNWLTAFYGQFASIFPLLMASPRYFAGQIKLGGLMQIASAFGQVQGALSYFVDVFSVNSVTGIANWKAVADRLSGFNDSIMRAEEMKEGIAAFKDKQPLNGIEADNLTLKLPDGRILLKNIRLSLKASDSLLITGISGTGKSTLLRALAGLWPFGEGRLILPEESRMLFVPQKPYLPLGSLRQALCYPGATDRTDDELKDVLALCGLAALSGKLEEASQWSNTLSLGEQQRVAFARVLLARPDFIFLDEATSALDEPAEARLYGLLKEKLPKAALVSVGHRAALRAFHAQEMVLG